MSIKARKLSAADEFLIYELSKAGYSGAKISRMVAQGYKDHPPFNVTGRHANNISRKIKDERGELYDSDLAKAKPDEAILKLARRLIHIADRESARLDKLQRLGRLDGTKVAGLAVALTRLHTLTQRIEEGEGDNEGDNAPKKGEDAQPKAKPDGAPASQWIADAVSEDNGKAPEPAPPPQPIADRKITPPPPTHNQTP